MKIIRMTQIVVTSDGTALGRDQEMTEDMMWVTDFHCRVGGSMQFAFELNLLTLLKY